ncbi:MAG: GHMP kinase [Acidimicrobiia bacterium]|nr:GHMP kinase [Acidimicrobiia bacterium]
MATGEAREVTTVVARAPVRICDAGGWTDTWFARTGLVCNLAVGPGVEVRVRHEPRSGSATVVLDVAAFGERYAFAPGEGPGRHPLLEAAIARLRPALRGAETEITITAAPPPGCGTGTSASVVVALLGALSTAAGQHTAAHEVAATAHGVEADDLGLQSGVQDQHAAAHGGACTITVEEYPTASVERLPLTPETVAALGRRVVTVYLGRPHRSSAIHEHVIESLRRDPRSAEQRLAPLRDAAAAAARALVRGDLDDWAHALAANTEMQAGLHPDLVCDDARRLIEVVRRHGAAGWKVNGAGVTAAR